ncbi:hypothetical protein OOT46_17445 [Aquabacterium sp. A7-Y]|uniref:hypothetical protein n=1 Tax=Aquabacterium sp. A7-Y TaxID=1349605 RepID=UPI00223D860A|nr:hypothetical protein [Aquabacterium sp. A7-Y]MCW7539631.1 hypothetical protein [Aquabacterium sp. A7-Y]
MDWLDHVAHFFVAVFAVNGVPHFVHGLSGRRFPTPFAKPPAVGDSRPLVNVVWGMANFALAWLLYHRSVPPRPGELADSWPLWAGTLVTALALSAHFSRVRRRKIRRLGHLA